MIAVPPQPPPPPATARARLVATAPAARVSALGLLRRGDLGSGWKPSLAAPAHPPPFACATSGHKVAAAASATWSKSAGAIFASGTSYAFGGAVAAQRAWARTGGTAMRRCLKRTLVAGSTRRVRLTATAVVALRPLRLEGVDPAHRIRVYRVSGTATGAGQQVPVTLDVVLAMTGTWIGEDEFSAVAELPPVAVEERAARAQIRRVLRP